jgi:branched-chain amino acid transport system permease protein
LLDPVVVDAVIFGSIFGLMSTGLTMTYLTTKVPNFSYGSVVALGIYTAFALNRADGLNPYYSIPYAFVVGSASSVAVYLLVLRPLMRRGSSLVALMIATLAVDSIFIGIINLFTTYMKTVYLDQTSVSGYDPGKFPRLPGDFTISGNPGILLTAPIALALVTGGLYLLLNRTKFGTAMRASIENPSLAKTVGINVERVYIIAWVVAGGLAGIAGPFYALHFGSSADVGSNFIVAIFAASVLGGLSSIYGAVLGGLVVGGSEILIGTWGSALVGSWLSAYESGIPLIAMVATLLFLPKGLVSINLRKLVRRRAEG